MTLKISLLVRILLTIVFTLCMGLAALFNQSAPGADAWTVAAVMGIVVLMSNWGELLETAAHMQHHRPHVHRVVNHETDKQQSADHVR